MQPPKVPIAIGIATAVGVTNQLTKTVLKSFNYHLNILYLFNYSITGFKVNRSYVENIINNILLHLPKLTSYYQLH